MTRLLVGLIRAYQLFLRPLLPGGCRFTPSCSHYAMDAIAIHGVRAGGWLALRRMGRCQPFGGSGWDPVPEAGHPPDNEERGRSAVASR
jgi:putative membrane protein insertion efficiency factor